KLLVPAGALCQASSGETFFPGQGQIAGSRGLQARLGSSAPNLKGMTAPSLMELEVTVIHPAASAIGAITHTGIRATRPARSKFMIVSRVGRLCRGPRNLTLGRHSSPVPAMAAPSFFLFF